MASALDVAAYLISKTDLKNGDGMTHMKLQKLLYYVQGFSLVINGSAIFGENIEAWIHGPVVREVYDQFKKYRNNIIQRKGPGEITNLTEKEKSLIDSVFDVYNQYSASKLRNLTHSEPPWSSYYGKADNIIPLPVMQEFFKTLITE